ncbi:MAG TPA: hypothetical protein VGN96_02785 [Roseococcus sp.]|jgi:hypothetical protein|nr:hypothetical protein [Roseococcus sp.]
MIRLPALLAATLVLAAPGAALAHHGDSDVQARAIREVQQQRARLLAESAPAQLRAASQALRAGRDAAAQEWLERAETRLLTGEALPVAGGAAVLSGSARHVSAARAAVRDHDNARAQREIDAAMALLGQSAAR